MSTNITNWQASPPHVVLEAIKREAALSGTHVIGTELIGLIPQGAVLAAGRFYLRNTPILDLKGIMRAGIKGLGLSVRGEFIMEKRVLEFAIKRAEKLK